MCGRILIPAHFRFPPHAGFSRMLRASYYTLSKLYRSLPQSLQAAAHSSRARETLPEEPAAGIEPEVSGLRQQPCDNLYRNGRFRKSWHADDTEACGHDSAHLVVIDSCRDCSSSKNFFLSSILSPTKVSDVVFELRSGVVRETASISPRCCDNDSS